MHRIGRHIARLRRLRERRHQHAIRLTALGLGVFSFSVTALVAQANGGYLSNQPLNFWGILERNILPIMTSIGISMLAYARLYWRQDNFERDQKTDRELIKSGLAAKADRDIVDQALEFHAKSMERVVAQVEGLREDLTTHLGQAVQSMAALAEAAKRAPLRGGRA